MGTLVQNPTAANGGGTTVAKAFGSNVTAGNTLVAFATTDHNTTHTFSSPGDVWQTVGPFFESGAGQSISIGVCFNATGGAKTVTCTFGTTGTFNGIIISEYSNTPAYTTLDTSTPGQHVTGGSPVTDASMTTTGDGDLIVSCTIMDAGGVTVTSSGIFTLLTQDTTDLMSAEFGTQTTHGSIAPFFNVSISANAGIISAALSTGSSAPAVGQQSTARHPGPGPKRTASFRAHDTGDTTVATNPDQTVTPSGIPGSEAFGAATITTTVTVTPGGVPSSEAFGAATVTSTISISPGSIGSSEAFGAASISQAVNPGGIPSSEAFGAATVSTTVTVTPGGIPSSERFGAATVFTASSVTPGGIPGGEAFGAATVSSTAFITPGGIPSAEAFGATTTTLFVTPGGIPSSERLGAATVQVITSITPGGIPSSEAFGAATVTSTVTVTPGGIPSSERFGAANVASAAAVITPGGIPSSERFGAAVVTTGPVTVSVGGITSSERFGGAIVSLGLLPQTIQVGGVPSSERIGASFVGNKVTPDITVVVSTVTIIWRADPVSAVIDATPTIISRDVPILEVIVDTPQA